MTTNRGHVSPVEIVGTGYNGAAHSAFGEPIATHNNVEFQGNFLYGTNAYVHETFTSNGTVTATNSNLQLSITSAANAYCVVRSKRYLQTKPGLGCLARFTAAFSTGVANLLQRAGFANNECALGFGFNGATPGVVRRSGGRAEMVTLVVTASKVGNWVVTLSQAVSGTVQYTIATTGGSTALTAAEIAGSALFNGTSSVWDAEALGATVYFTKRVIDAVNGTPDLAPAAGGGAGTIARSRTGVAHVDDWIAQTAWNVDTMDGNGPSRMVLDWTKGNVFSVLFQWLGYGNIVFAIENSATGLLQEVHRIRYANSATQPSLLFPAMQVEWTLASLGSTTAATMTACSYMVSVQGKQATNAVIRAFTASRQVTAGTPLQLCSIRPIQTYKTVINRGECRLMGVSVSTSSAGTRTGTITLLLNGTIATPPFLWTQADANSMVSTDTTSVNVTGGIQVWGASMPSTGALTINLKDYGIVLIRDDILTVVATSSSGTIDFSVTLYWHENQ